MSGEGAGETGRRGRAAETVTADAGLQDYEALSSGANERVARAPGESDVGHREARNVTRQPVAVAVGHRAPR